MIGLHRHTPAIARISDEAFLREWMALADACPHGTCYQQPPFVLAWYRCYAEVFEPVVIEERDDDGTLSGLFCLARDRRTGDIIGAGRDQAEYHAWLARPAQSCAFFERALDLLAHTWPDGHIQFLFAAPGLALELSPRWRSRVVHRPIPRPLMSTGPEAPLAESMKKSANRSRLNRLKKLGLVSFERLTTVDALSAALDEIIPFYECRQGAIHAALPFHLDPHKRAFLLALMAEPGLLHTTVLRVNGRVIAAHIGPCNGRQVVLGIIAHSPFYSKYSAGKLLIRFLGLKLQEEGFSHLDLTPGGEYKDRFASDHDEASVLDVWFQHKGVRAYKLQRALIDAGKRFVSTDRLKEQVAYARHKAGLIRPAEAPRKVLNLARLAAHGAPSVDVYRREAASVSTTGVERLFARDSLWDLTTYEPSELWQPPVPAFLRMAMERLERGEHVYTCVRDGRLACVGWLIEQADTMLIPELQQTVSYPAGSSLIYDGYTDPRYRRLGLYSALIRQAAADTAAEPATRAIYMSVLAHNPVSRHAVERAGFTLERTIAAAGSPLSSALATVAHAAGLAMPILTARSNPSGAGAKSGTPPAADAAGGHHPAA